MRELGNSSNFIRKSNNKEFTKFCFIVPEGDVTEIRYFEGLKNNSEYLHLNKLIKLSIIENEQDEFGQSHLKRKIENFEASVKEGKIDYDKDVDTVVFVFDRDPQNFKENQYDTYVEKCCEKGYILCISNPTFELFLLMHDNQIFTLDRKMMLENRKQSSKRFLELQVEKFFHHNKRNLNFDIYKSKIKTAIKNEKEFCEDLIDLKNQLGSNVGKFIDTLMNDEIN